jgi:hypothetical protein
MAIPSWVNLVGWVLALLVSVLLYRDARVRLRALGTKLATLAPFVEAAEGERAKREEVGAGLHRTLHADDADGPVTPHSTRPGDDGRRTNSAPPPPVRVL